MINIYALKMFFYFCPHLAMKMLLGVCRGFWSGRGADDTLGKSLLMPEKMGGIKNGSF